MTKLSELIDEIAVAMAREGEPFQMCRNAVAAWADAEDLPDEMTRDEFYDAFGKIPPTLH